MIRPLLFALALTAFVSNAIAREEAPVTYDRINLSVSAEQQVDNDTLVAVMYAQQEGNDPGRLAREVNQRIQRAVERAKKNPAIRVQTLDYHTSPIYRKELLAGWRVRQSVRLESQESAALSELIGDLQQELGVENISYAISPQRRKESEDRLITEAIGRFKQRAKMITTEIGRPGYRLVEMNVNTTGYAPRAPQVRAMAMEAQAAAPILEAGTQRVEVRINGTIELTP
jgi:predicted secreted protein